MQEMFANRRFILLITVCGALLIIVAIAAGMALRSAPPPRFMELVRERAVFPPECANWVNDDPDWQPDEAELAYGWGGTDDQYQSCMTALSDSNVWQGPYFFYSWHDAAEYPFSPECDGKYEEILNSEAPSLPAGGLEAAGFGHLDVAAGRTYAWSGTWDERVACYPTSPEAGSVREPEEQAQPVVVGSEEHLPDRSSDRPSFYFTITVEQN